MSTAMRAAGLAARWMRRQDLEQRAFDKAWAILQCH
ncbi:MAG: DUF1963 domain-containing protein [Planctomycetes bacterium]|nr:DUF1963 domain-containing protein [Planctomycetota bacterium]